MPPITGVRAVPLGNALQVDPAGDPARAEDGLRAAHQAEPDVHREVVADHAELARRKAEVLLDRAHGGVRRLADDDRPRAARLGDRRRSHRAAAEDRAVRAGVGRDVAGGQQLRAADHGAGRSFELLEVDRVGMRDEDGVDRPVVSGQTDAAGGEEPLRTYRRERRAQARRAGGSTGTPGRFGAA